MEPDLFLVCQDDYICSSCLFVLQEPHLMSCCGAHLCKKCIDRFQSAKKPSPCCHESFGNYTTLLDKGVKRRIDHADVHCVNRRKECQWNGKLQDLAHHLEHDCLEQLQACPNKCGGMFPRHLLSHHVKQQCSATSVSSLKSEIKEDKTAATTTATSTVTVPAEEQFDTTDVRREVELKVQEAVKDLMAKNEREEKSSYHRLEEKLLETIKSYQEEAEKKFVDYQKEIEDKFEMQQTGIASAMIKEEKTKNEKPTPNSEAAQSDWKWIDSQWSVPISSTTTLLPLPPCFMTMTGFENHKKERKEWFSPPVYSSPTGYRFVVGVMASGTGPGKNTHVSLAVYLAKGEYDEKLNWPFRGRFNISLLNWREPRHNDIDAVVIFDDRAKVNGLSNRVTHGDRASKGNGYSKLVGHNNLYLNISKNTEYLHNDTLCFLVTAVHAELLK